MHLCCSQETVLKGIRVRRLSIGSQKSLKTPFGRVRRIIVTPVLEMTPVLDTQTVEQDRHER